MGDRQACNKNRDIESGREREREGERDRDREREHIDISWCQKKRREVCASEPWRETKE